MPTLSTAIDGLLFSWNKNLAYGENLVSDLNQDQMIAQPRTADVDMSALSDDIPQVNHPAWILAHLNLYHAVIISLINGEEFEDPKDHRYGMQSKPKPDSAEYPDKETLLADWRQGHASVEAALKEVGPISLEKAVKLPRWKDKMPKVGIALPYLMILHENVHLGQLSAWRRMQNLPSV